VAKISVGGLFLGGLLPGILIGFSLMGISAIVCRRRGYGETTTTAFSINKVVAATRKAILPLIAPIIVVGGILTGVFTPTESGGVAAVYTLFLGLCVYRKIRFFDLPNIFVEAIVTAANVVLIIATCSLLSWFLTKNGVPQAISSFLLSISDSKWFILFAVNLIFFIGGMFLEGLALIIMFVPILLPVAVQVGIDPLLFGVMVVINIAIGTLTPPVGVCLFVASSAGKEKFEEVTHKAVPFIGALVAVLVLCCIFPEIITYFPSKMIR
jgi:C4-dicarboxylate transporter DctM subunit